MLRSLDVLILLLSLTFIPKCLKVLIFYGVSLTGNPNLGFSNISEDRKNDHMRDPKSKRYPKSKSVEETISRVDMKLVFLFFQKKI